MRNLIEYISVFINSLNKRGLARTILFVVGEYWFDIRYRVSTRPHLLSADSGIVGSHLFSAAPHYGTNWFVLKNVFQELIRSNIVNPPSEHMIDFGCGAGRALMAGQLFGLAKVTGVEFSETLCLRAVENLRKFEKMNLTNFASQWEVVHADACSYEIPRDASLFFLYNPFGHPVIDVVARNMMEFSRSAKQPIKIIYVNPVYGKIFERLGYSKLQESCEEVAIYANTNTFG